MFLLHARLALIQYVDLTYASFLGDIDRVAARGYVPSTGEKQDFPLLNLSLVVDLIGCR
jgi:hypothetical protein